MKKILVLVLSIFALLSCEKKWTSSLELGVNQKRVNISQTQGGEFYYSIFSNTDWTLTVECEDAWLTPDVTEGSGRATIKFEYTINEGESARYAKCTLTAVTGASVTFFVVQRGSKQAATDVEDVELI